MKINKLAIVLTLCLLSVYGSVFACSSDACCRTYHPERPICTVQSGCVSQSDFQKGNYTRCYG